MDNRDKRWVRKAIDDRLRELGLLPENESGLEPEDEGMIEDLDQDQDQDQDPDDDNGTGTGDTLHNQIAEQFQQAMNL